MLSGASHSNGGINLGEIGEAEGGEYFGIINKRMTRRYGDDLPSIFDSINSGRFHDVFGRANVVLKSEAAREDQWTKKIYERLGKQANIYTDSDGNQVVEKLGGGKRIIKQNG